MLHTMFPVLTVQCHIVPGIVTTEVRIVSCTDEHISKSSAVITSMVLETATKTLFWKNSLSVWTRP